MILIRIVTILHETMKCLKTLFGVDTVREHLPDALVTEDTKTFRIVIHRNTKRIVITGHGVRTNTVLIEVVRQKRSDLRLTYAGTTANGQNELILVLLLSLLCHHRNQSL